MGVLAFDQLNDNARDLSVFGPAWDATVLRHAARRTLETWSPTYIARYGRAHDFPDRALPRIESWVFEDEVADWPSRKLPSVLIICPGTVEDPMRDGRGLHRVTFELGIAVIVSTSKRHRSIDIADITIAALRDALLQNSSLGGVAIGMRWTGQRSDVLEPRQNRNLAAGQCTFHVEVADVANARGGPAVPEPQDDPDVTPADWPDVKSVEADIDPQEIE